MNPKKMINKMYRLVDKDTLHFGSFLNHEIVGIVNFFEEKKNN